MLILCLVSPENFGYWNETCCWDTQAEKTKVIEEGAGQIEILKVRNNNIPDLSTSYLACHNLPQLTTTYHNLLGKLE